MGGVWGWDWDWEECLYVGVHLYVCTCVHVEWGEMCNLKLGMCRHRQRSTAFVLGIPPEGILSA